MIRLSEDQDFLPYQDTQYLIIYVIANVDQRILNQTSVGIVFTVEDQIKPTLDIKAKTYSHQISIPKSNPGIIINALITKAKNSTVFALFQ